LPQFKKVLINGRQGNDGADAIMAADSVAVLGLVAESAMIVVAEKGAREEFSFKKHEMKENATTTITTMKTSTTTTTTTTTKDNSDVNLELLPPLVIGHLALFLPRSSRALLGAALTPSVQCNWTNDEWETLDFSDLDKDLAAKLTDDDLYNCLKWIDATKRLKILKLTGCVNIIGHGLRILLDAINLRQIDLSLVGRNESPVVVPEPALAQAVVLPILSSMVKSKHVDIKHIQMPKHWRIVENNLGLKQFFALYSKRLSKRCDCSQCDERICRGGKRKKWMNENGLQKFTCYQCMDCFCTRCVNSCECDVDLCGTCEKFLCDECGPVMTCSKCSEMACEDCKPIDFCEVCSNVFCDDCVPTGWCDVCNRILCSECCPVSFCDGEGCHKATCMDCATHTQGVWWCNECEDTFCPDCRLNQYRKNRDEFCMNCQGTLLHLVESENESLRRQLEELRSLNQSGLPSV